MHFRYPLSAVAEMAGLVITAFVIVAGADAYPGTIGTKFVEAGERLAGFVGFFIALVGTQGPSKVVRDEADTGTLEQLSICRPNLMCIIIARVMADTMRLIPILILALGAVAHISGIEISLPFIKVFVILLAIGVGMSGWGFLIASLVLLYERMGFLINLFSLAMLPLAILPMKDLPASISLAAAMVPFRWGNALLQGAIMPGAVGPESVWTSVLAPFLASSVATIAIGIAVFAYADRIARKDGLLGKY